MDGGSGGSQELCFGNAKFKMCARQLNGQDMSAVG